MLSSLTAKKEHSILIGVILILNVWHFLAIDYYDFGKDEYYKMALSNRMDWGYLGTMPFSVWVIGLTTSIFGKSLVVVRIIPALLSLITSYLLVKIVDEFAGDFKAKLLAIVAFLNAPIIMGTFHMYSQNSIDVFFWAFATLLVLKYERTRAISFWYCLMVCLGIALMNRLTILWFGFTYFLYTLFYHRKWMSSIHFWIGGFIPFALFSPILYWQINHSFAHFNYIIDSSSGHISTFHFWLNQILIHNPLNLIIWLSGATFLILSTIRKNSPYIAMAFIAVGSLIIVTWLGREKAYNFYYATPIYSILYPIGAITITRLVPKVTRARTFIICTLFVSSLLTAIVFFSPLSLSTYQQLTTLSPVKYILSKFDAAVNIPPQIVNQYGWRRINETFQETQKVLSEKGVSDYTIWPNHYSIASTIEILNPALKNKVISHSESYWLFGYPEEETVFLVICDDGNDMLALFEEVEVIKSYLCLECPIWRSRINFYLAKRPINLKEYWSSHLKY